MTRSWSVVGGDPGGWEFLKDASDDLIRSLDFF
jgi:hypothetical protein